MVNFLFNQSMMEYLKEKKRKLSDHSIAACLCNLFRVEPLVRKFLGTGGFNKLVAMLKQNSDDIQTAYYTLVAFWILSFEGAAK